VKNNKPLVWQYVGLAFQLFVSVGLAAYAGWWLDAYFIFSIPLLVWILPLLVIIGLLVKVIKDTSS